MTEARKIYWLKALSLWLFLMCCTFSGYILHRNHFIRGVLTHNYILSKSVWECTDAYEETRVLAYLNGDTVEHKPVTFENCDEWRRK